MHSRTYKDKNVRKIQSGDFRNRTKESKSLACKLGAYLAKDKYDIEDEEILMAIRSHTTGRPGMSLLEKIDILQI